MDLLRGVVRDYDWGDRRAIAELLGRPPPGHPEAELWLGAHPSAPSSLVEADCTLDQLLRKDPLPVVGPSVAERFSGMPFLLKVLAAERPLSIQAHPSLTQAKAGYARENRAGVDLAAPDRSYRDDNHKPELICALTPFDAKCGFRPVEASLRLLSAMADARVQPLRERLAAEGSEEEVLAEVVGWLLGLPRGEAGALSDAAREVADGHRQSPRPELEEFGQEMTWTINIHRAFPGDIGVVVALLLNHVSLQPGQAVFLQAGNLHSYLRGVGVELMANSDNVLRGGLTSKHIDVDELLDVVDYRPAAAPVQTPSGSVHTFDSPVPEFSLTRLDSTSQPFETAEFEPVGPEILLVTAGRVTAQPLTGPVADRSQGLEIGSGSAALVCYGDGRYRVVDDAPGQTVAWRAAVGTDLY